ncbi:pyrin domain-containing protein 2, partial [Carlito syrichta]|uniref:Pyrin domain-containing protein 2 n=1 Tax=Carlito syrichta TaxID=1868482 RepID=A0A3Q0DT80_CARSF
MASSAPLDFDLLNLLEQLNQDELSTFKALVRTLALQNELQQVSPVELDQAGGKQLAEILTTRCPRDWVEVVAIQVFVKMNRAELSERVKDQLRERALKSLQANKPPSSGMTWTEKPPREDLEEILQRLEEREP